MEKDSSNIIAGKKCIVVAPSRYLRGRGKASARFIDSFDLVVKTTDMCEMRDPLGELGHRCDVWYGMPGNASGWRVNLSALHKQGVQLMILQPYLARYENAWNEYVDWFKQQALPTGIRYEIADTAAYQALMQRCDSVPLSGIFAVFDLLNRGASQVQAYGHDFYRTGYFFDSDFQANTQVADWHQLDPQMAAVWQLIQDEPRFHCDENLRYLLEEKFCQNFDADLAFSRLIRQELDFFGSSFSLGHTALIRTCNLRRFAHIYQALCLSPLVQHLEVIVQNSVSLPAPDPIQQVNIHQYQASDKFSCSGLLAEMPFAPGQLDTMFIPYNGLALWTYLDVFQYCVELKISNVFLISARGIVRRIEDLENECNAIREYLALRNQFNQYVQRYDRKNCI